MLTESELNEVKGLLHYLNNSMTQLKPDDVKLIDANGEHAATVGMAPHAEGYVLKEVPVQP